MTTCLNCSNKINKEEASYFQASKYTLSWNEDKKTVWTYTSDLIGGPKFFYCSEYCLCKDQQNSYF